MKPLVRFEGLPGEFKQRDFGQVDVESLQGSGCRIHIFASRLKDPRCVRVPMVKEETVKSLVRNLAEHLHSWVEFGVRVDRPKTVALSALTKAGSE
jgi:hypothetical protein